MSIPKTIHYCWFGGEPEPIELIQHRKGWISQCPDYRIQRWDESNFDVNTNVFTKKAVEAGRFDFLSDYVRLYVLSEYGGIYVDTDVEIIKPLDSLLENDCFFGLEDFDSIASGLMCGSIPHQKCISELLDIYDCDQNVDRLLKMNCIDITTDYFRTKGFVYRNREQSVGNCTIYPTRYFCPEKYGSRILRVKEETYSIHHYDRVSAFISLKLFIGRVARRLLGREFVNRYLRSKKV